MRISNYSASIPRRGHGDIEAAASHYRDRRHEATWVDHTSAAGAAACRCRRYPSSGIHIDAAADDRDNQMRPLSFPAAQ
jgi:hypothetical protein